MPAIKDDVTTQDFSRIMRRALEVMSTRTHMDRASTETPLRIPFDPFYLGVIDIGAIFKEIIALVNGEESDEEGIVRPTQHALDRATYLLVGACNAFPVKFPMARVAPDLGGGLRIEWKSDKGVVRLVVPPADGQREYLYTRIGGKSQTEFSLSGEVIATWLHKVA